MVEVPPAAIRDDVCGTRAANLATRDANFNHRVDGADVKRGARQRSVHLLRHSPMDLWPNLVSPQAGPARPLLRTANTDEGLLEDRERGQVETDTVLGRPQREDIA
jgi:hypothetical protein